MMRFKKETHNEDMLTNNDKISVELLCTEQRVRLMLKATYNIKR
jgi:hypothetical protein